MKSRHILAVSLVLVLITNQLAFASPSINMTMNSGQVTPAMTVKDNSGNI